MSLSRGVTLVRIKSGAPAGRVTPGFLARHLATAHWFCFWLLAFGFRLYVVIQSEVPRVSAFPLLFRDAGRSSRDLLFLRSCSCAELLTRHPAVAFAYAFAVGFAFIFTLSSRTPRLSRMAMRDRLNCSPYFSCFLHATTTRPDLIRAPLNCFSKHCERSVILALQYRPKRSRCGWHGR